MRKNYFVAVTVVAVCFLFFACDFSQVEAGGSVPSVSMLEGMKNSVNEIRIFLMAADYEVYHSDLDSLKQGWFPEWDVDCLSWFFVPVINRQYDAVIRVPVGNYKILVLAIGGTEGWTGPVFFSASDKVVSVAEGKTATPEILMEPLGFHVEIHANVDPGLVGSAGISFVSGEQPGTNELIFWERNNQMLGFTFLPYGATNVTLSVFTDKELVAPISWGDVIDGVVAVNLKPQLAGGILAPVIVWPSE